MQHVGKPWVDKFGRVRQPQQYLEDDDGHLIAAGAQATAMVTAMMPAAPAEVPSPPSASRAAARPTGRAPRAARNARRRGSRRGQRASSSSSDDPEPPPPWRSRCDPWALTLVDRAPVLWRCRAARCRLNEIREAIRMGVDR